MIVNYLIINSNYINICSGNNIGANGAASISEALKKLTELNSL